MGRKRQDSDYAIGRAFSRIHTVERVWMDGRRGKEKHGVLLAPAGVVHIMAWPGDALNGEPGVELKTVHEGRVYYRMINGVSPSARGLAHMAGRFLRDIVDGR